MKIAILGGGLSGLTSAFFLSKKNRHEIALFEKEPILGGMASGFRSKNWQWHLEKTYHHFFSNDSDILDLMADTGFNDIFFQKPESVSLYDIPGCKPSGQVNYRTFTVDTPQDFLRFPLLSLPDKLRSGMIIAFLKLSPFFSFYERSTAEDFLKKSMGDTSWNILWEELFRKKFGKYAENVVAAFFWARIKKRTKKLGYISGGFQRFIDHLGKRLERESVIINKNVVVERISSKGGKFEIRIKNKPVEIFDAIISTLPTPVLMKVGEGMFADSYIDRLKKIKYLHGTNLIIETKKPFFDKAYWVNVNVKEFPFMALVQHTNFIDKKNYGGNNLLYVGNYVDGNNRLLKMSSKQTLDFYYPFLKKINGSYGIESAKTYLFSSYFAQPVFDRSFLDNRPGFETPIDKLFIANLDMTYPYDRGTNYAVAIGRQVVSKYF
ncbi:FAD-dependent oxidoreductase [Candidatus Roizmanbacteria bacterium]|nr:FAD-dependent oxidoreductase [Candidatus Roizmanbacteria bacterium]